MRSAQLRYFKTRDRNSLQDSIELEKKVDDVLTSLEENRRYLAGESAAQARLFQ